MTAADRVKQTTEAVQKLLRSSNKRRRNTEALTTDIDKVCDALTVLRDFLPTTPDQPSPMVDSLENTMASAGEFISYYKLHKDAYESMRDLQPQVAKQATAEYEHSLKMLRHCAKLHDAFSEVIRDPNRMFPQCVDHILKFLQAQARAQV